MNKSFLYTFLLLLLVNLLAKKVCAQDSMQVEAWDRSKVDYRPASKQQMEAYKQMDVYLYDRFKKPETFWDKVKRWLWKQLINSGVSGNFILYLLIGVAVIILLFVILKLLGVKITGLFAFTNDNKVTNLNFKQSPDNIYDENLESTLKTAIKNKAFREAVRLMYLLSLRHLDAASLIEWELWKTNKDYYYELSAQEIRTLFKDLMLRYEYAWYGQITVGEDFFSQVKAKYNELELVMGNKKTPA